MNPKHLIWLLVLLLCGCEQVEEHLLPIHECAAPPEGRAVAMSFAWENTIYIVSGRMENGRYSDKMMTYSVDADTWQTELPTPLAARANGVACTNSNAVYLGLGFKGGSIYESENHLKDFWRYEPASDTWTRLADFPSEKTVATIAVANDEYVWVGFGFNGFGDEWWCYSIAEDAWTAAEHEGEWPDRLMSMKAACCNGRYFAGTGYHRGSKTGWWEFIPATRRWERKASLPGQGRHNAACAATDESVWIAGGWHYGDSLTTGFHFQDILRYSPTEDKWERSGLIPCGPTENGVACGVGRRMYFGLGESNQYQLYRHWYYIEE